MSTVRSERLTPDNIGLWRERAHEIAKPHYDTLGSIVIKDAAIGGRVQFVAQDGRVLSFIVSFDLPLDDGKAEVPATYLGLSATVPGAIGRGVRMSCATALYETLRLEGRSHLTVATCGTAPTLQMMRRLCAATSPGVDIFSAQQRTALLLSFRQAFGYPSPTDGDDPAVIRSASAARFTQAEYERQTSPRYADAVFDAFNINERDGDRLIVLSDLRRP